MSSIFGGSNSTPAESSLSSTLPKGKGDDISIHPTGREFIHGDVDHNARKEAVMASVRNELALANAQELINVCLSLHVSPPNPNNAIIPRAVSRVLGWLTLPRQKTNEKCYAKCVTKPSTSLSSSEEVRLRRNLFHSAQRKRKKKKTLSHSKTLFFHFLSSGVFFFFSHYCYLRSGTPPHIDVSLALLRPVHGSV
jgi:Tim10/DDP family zinc finger